jgi:hypothetical protein
MKWEMIFHLMLLPLLILNYMSLPSPLVLGFSFSTLGVVLTGTFMGILF